MDKGKDGVEIYVGLIVTIIVLNRIIAMRKIILNFYECEHYGDLDNYASDVEASGGVIESREVDTEEEIGTLECSVPQDFWDRFKTTSSYEMLDS